VGNAGPLIKQALIAIVVAAFVVACLRLGLWQWERYTSGGGTVQNLGYTLQWPTFAAFAVFMWWRLRRLERQRRQQPERQAQSSPALQPATQPPKEPPAFQPRATVTPAADEPEDELAAYNRYLAELHAQHYAKERNRGR
jgi:DNA-binding transcriptional regulator of glucitol operon